MSCYKCKCKTCMNNVSQRKIGDEFSKKGGIICFNCEDCYYYDHQLDILDNYRIQCLTYIESDISIFHKKQTMEKIAITRRKDFRIIRREE